MEEPTRKFLLQSCIPELAKSIDKINIISPLAQDELFAEQGAEYPVREFVVEKIKGKSTLERVT